MNIKIADAAELLARPPRPIEWLVRDLIPLGTAGDVFGPPGDRKTSITLDLALAIASGAGAWYGLPIISGPVVLLGGERSGRDTLARDLHRLAQGRVLEGGMLLSPADDDGECPPIRAWNRERSGCDETVEGREISARLADCKPVLVIIDTVLSVTSGGNIVDVDQQSKLGRAIRRWTRQLGTTTLTISHTNQARARDPLELRLNWISRQGSSGLPGAVRWLAGVSRLREDDKLARFLDLADDVAHRRLIAIGVSKHNEMPRPAWSDRHPAIFEMPPDGSLALVKDGREVAESIAKQSPPRWQRPGRKTNLRVVRRHEGPEGGDSDFRSPPPDHHRASVQGVYSRCGKMIEHLTNTLENQCLGAAPLAEKIFGSLAAACAGHGDGARWRRVPVAENGKIREKRGAMRRGSLPDFGRCYPISTRSQ